jgi:Kef-type K+ transport system membrane component KefB
MKNFFFIFLIGLTVITPVATFASTGTSDNHHAFAITFLFLAIIILFSKIGGLFEKIGQPPVLGELLVGIILGNLALFGFSFFDQMKNSEFIAFLSELGVVILLFQIGLESNINEMRKVGTKAFLVGVVGVISPFILGTYVVGPYLFPGQDMNTYLFLGAALTATSVGITARVFKDLGKIKTNESKIILGAAVIDDILGLLILAVISAIVAVGSITFLQIGIISLKAIFFLIISVAVGLLIAPHMGKLFSKIQAGAGTKTGLALTFCFTFAYLASLVGLAPIVGAFAAGLVLDSVHFKWFKSHSLVSKIRKINKNLKDPEAKAKIKKEIDLFHKRHVAELIEDIAYFVVPIFFVYTGMQVDISTFADPKILLMALGFTVAAFLGKLVSGLVAGKEVNKWVIGFGMIPRGEVGLIFASVGMGLGVVTAPIYSVIVIMVIVTTLIPPLVLNKLLKK